MYNNYGFVIQARMGSKRLPGKSLKKINKTPILGWIINSLKQETNFNNKKIIVATSKNQIDDIIEEYSKSKNVSVFRGSEKNVLKRYYDCATKFQIKNIVRLTADNPFVNVYYLKKMLKNYFKNKYDYISTKEYLPIGIGAEIISFKALKKSYLVSKSIDEKEHVVNYVLNNKKKFKTKILKFNLDHKIIEQFKFTVDTKEDLVYCRNHVKKINKKNIKKFIYDADHFNI
jgi:spore coat polysaccharide biosynthesis protein SpsF